MDHLVFFLFISFFHEYSLIDHTFRYVYVCFSLRKLTLPYHLIGIDVQDKRYDFTNVADLACSLQTLNIEGSTNHFGTSNIVPNELTFDFVPFKSLTKLVLTKMDCCPEKIETLGLLRNTLQHLEATDCKLKSIADILLCDTHHLDKEDITQDPGEEFVHAGNKIFGQNYLSLLRKIAEKNIVLLMRSLIFIIRDILSSQKWQIFLLSKVKVFLFLSNLCRGKSEFGAVECWVRL